MLYMVGQCRNNIRERNYLISEPNYHATKFFKKKVLAIEMRILLNKLVWLGLSILDLSEIVMYAFWYEFVKPKSGENVKFIDTYLLFL